MSEDVDENAVQPEPVLPPKPQTVLTKSLRPNPHNPRILFDEEPLQTLEDSIRKVGILVPLTVYKATGSTKFTILDGQRRWMCAQRIGLDNVPINAVTEPSLAQNIVTMFQIHKLRKDWELMPTALKLGVLIDELSENRDKALAALTGLDSAVVIRCKKLLSFEEQYQNRMLDPNPEIRLNADLFIEMYPIITDRTVRRAPWYNRNQMIDALIDMYLQKACGFKSVTDFRKIKAALTNARKADSEKEVIDRLEQFIEGNSLEISDLEIESARFHREAESLSRNLKRLRQQVEQIDADSFAAEEDLWLALEELLVEIRNKLEAAERRTI